MFVWLASDPFTSAHLYVQKATFQIEKVLIVKKSSSLVNNRNTYFRSLFCTKQKINHIFSGNPVSPLVGSLHLDENRSEFQIWIILSSQASLIKTTFFITFNGTN